MGFERTVDQRIWGVTTQNATNNRMTTGDSSGGTFTPRVNPLGASLFWDSAMYVLQNVAVAGAATGGSYSITIQTDAVAGFTGLPIASVTGVGPNSATTLIMDNLHQSPSSPLPTHMLITQTAAGGGLTMTCDVVARQYRGTLGTAGQGTSERVLQGVMIRGNSSTVDFSGDEGFNASATFTIGTSGSTLGMNRMRFWDHALYWAVAGNSQDGGFDIDIVSSVGGNTVTIATTGAGSALNAADEKLAIANQFFGQSPNPTAIIWTENTGGDGISDVSIVMLAKSGRGGLATKR